ncbi:MAG: hypothetical protein J6R67_03150 [Treponema sp.]|nr:hypothetical protein [Treponema sp.]
MGSYSHICLFKALIYTGSDTKVEHGFCFANNFTDAIRYIEGTLYGNDLLEIEHMGMFDACPIVSADTWENMRKELGEE